MSVELREAAATSAETIRIRGARVHNLQNLDLDIPRDQLVVITGPSGSGKSSLAFDTLYAEGQRQYIESLSVYARQFLHQLERPDVDLIEGLQPTISIDQRAGSLNPRSTVATVTEIYDYLRLLYARLGEAACYQCGAPIRQQSPEQILDALTSLDHGCRMMILAPLVRGRKGEHKEVLAAIRKAGLLRARVNGVVVDLDQPPELSRQKTHHIEAVVDRVVIREGIRARLAESIKLALKYSEGLVLASYEQRNGAEIHWRDELFSTLYACPNCRISLEELEPRTFSFNSPYGACPTCEGLGVRVAFDPELVVSDTEASLSSGGIVPWKGESPAAERKHRAALKDLLASLGIRWNTPFSKLPADTFCKLLQGDGQLQGVFTLLEKEYATTTSQSNQQRLGSFRGELLCPECHGARLRVEARSVHVAGRAIHELTALSVEQARQFFGGLQFDGK